MCLIGIAKHKQNFSTFSSNIALSSKCSSASLSEQATNFSSKYVLLNPGPNYEIESNDVCLYMSIVKEENFNWKAARTKICNMKFKN